MDHGGLIVAARDYNQYASGILKYSTDEGYHWYDFAFSPSIAVVLGTYTDRKEQSTDVRLVLSCAFELHDF